MKYYFVSDKNLDGETLYPRIPKNRMFHEDSSIERICVSQSINGCLTAVGGIEIGDIYYIHECEISNDDIVQPSLQQVPDRCFTGELWVVTPTCMKLFMVIMATGLLDTQINTMSNPLYSFKLREDLM